MATAAGRTRRSAGDRPDHRRSRPAFAPVPRPPAGAPNVLVIVLDDLGFAQLGCFGSDIATPDDRRPRRRRPALQPLPRHRAVLADAGLPAHRPQPPPGRHGVPHRHPDRLPRLHGPHPAARPPRCPGCCATPATARSPSASGTWRPAGSSSASGPFDRWPLGLGFERYYGFLNGDTNQWTPDLVRDNGFVDPPRPPEDGYHLTEDLADRAIRLIQRPAAGDAGQAVLPLLRHRRGRTPPTRRRPSGSTRYRGQFDDGWEAWRERDLRPPGRGRASSPRARRSPSGRRGCPTGTRCPPTSAALFARMMEVFAGFLTHTDAQIGRLLDFLRATGAARRHPRAAHLRQRHERRGRPDRLVQRAPLHPRPRRRPGRHAGPHRRPRRPPRLQPLPVGLGLGRQHAAAAVEALHLAGRRAHAAHRPLAGGHRRAPRRGPRPVLPRRRPAADRARRGRARRARRASTASPSSRSTAPACWPTFADAGRRRRPRRTQYFEMLGSRAIYHDGWKATTDHVGNQITVEREQVLGQPRLRRRPLGAVPPRRRLRRGPRRRRPSTPSGCAALRGAVVGTRPAATRCCRSTTAWSAGRWRWNADPWPPRHRVASTGPAAAASPRTSCRAMGGGFRLVGRGRRARRRWSGRRLRARRLEQRLGVVPARRPAGR